MRVHAVSFERRYQSYLFPTFAAGLEAGRKILQTGKLCSAFPTKRKRSSRWTCTVPRRPHSKRFRSPGDGWGAHLLLAFDGPPYEAKVPGRTARKLQGLPLGSSPGRRWSRERFMHPYLRDALMDMGYASLYFTVIDAAPAGEEEQQWRAFKSAVSEAIVNHSGTISHHHGIGTDHRPWLPRERGPLAVDMLKGIKRQLDPFGIMNPEKLI